MSSYLQPDEAETGSSSLQFITSTQVQTHPLYFHYKVDSSSSSLQVEVLGPNISFTFHHRRARQFISASALVRQLQNKTVGFLALLDKNGKRVILASAQSGHGSGKYGELLDKTKGILENKIWTRRVIAIGKILGLNMKRPYDSGRVSPAKPEHEGLFLGSHVEVKLAVHAICVLLDIFNITKDCDNLTERHLKRLRHVRQEDGSRPTFEVYFSRKNCKPCGNLVKKLVELTGVTIRLCWRHRLEIKTYIPAKKRDYPGKPDRELQQEFDEQAVDMNTEMDLDADVIVDDDSEDTAEEELKEIECVDLTIRSPSHSPPLIIEPTPAPNSVDEYIEGLAYRVGQIETSPDEVAEDIVPFVKSVHRHNMNQRKLTTPNGKQIDKPLPATPVIEDPMWSHDGEERANTPQLQTSSKPRVEGGLRRSRAAPSGWERVPARDRTPRPHRVNYRERASLSETPTRQGRIRVEIPARGAST